MITLKDLERLAELLDELGIHYEDGCLYDCNRYGDEIITGHWLTIPKIELETTEISIEDKLWNDGERDDEPSDDYDECGFDPYEGCYTFDC